jgi:D-amino-acid dehydrogenase
MMPDTMPRVGRGRRPNVFYNTGHGHLGWTLSAVTAGMIGGLIQAAADAQREVTAHAVQWNGSRLGAGGPRH